MKEICCMLNSCMPIEEVHWTEGTELDFALALSSEDGPRTKRPKKSRITIYLTYIFQELFRG